MLCGDGHWKPLNQCILKTVCVYGSDFSKNTHFISKMTCLSGSFWRLESGFSLSMRLPVRIYISIKLLWFRSKYSLFLSWIQVLFTCKLLVSVPKSFHWKMERINKLFHPSDHETENNSCLLIHLQEFFNDKPLNGAICTCKWWHTCDWKQTFTKKSSVLCEYCCILKRFNL